MREFLDAVILCIGGAIIALILWGIAVALWQSWRGRGG